MSSQVKSLMSTGEVELDETHQHPFWLISQIWLPLLMIIGLFVLIIFSGSLSNLLLSNAEVAAGGRPNNIWWVALLLMLVPLAIIAVQYVRWRNHMFVVTNRRVITLQGVVNKVSTDMALEKINDITMAQNWQGRAFGFGSVILESGNDEPLRLVGISQPLDFKKAILNAKAGVLDVNGSVRQVQPVMTTANPAMMPPLVSNVPPVVSAATPASRNAQALRELEELRSQGLVSDEEYNQKRAEILRRM